MESQEKLFKQISENLVQRNTEVTIGKMMSSPGLKFRNKVFAFFHNNEMTFKLGKDFVPKDNGIKEYSLLSPFKNKPPLSGWFCVPYSQSDLWRPLCAMALERINRELGK